MEEKVELQVSGEEFERVKNRVKGKNYLLDLERLETTLLLLKYRHLLERFNEVETRLSEVQRHWESLVEFEKKAKEDKTFLMEARKTLNEENILLERKVMGVESDSQRRETVETTHG